MHMNTHTTYKKCRYTHTRKRECTPWDARNGKKKEDYPASCTKRQKSQAWKEARSRIRTKVAGFKVQNDNQLHQSSTQHALSPNLKNIFLQNSPKQQQFSFQKRTFFFTSSSSSHFCFFIRCGVVSNNNQ